MVAVRPDDLSMAFDFGSYAATMEHNAYVSLDTGKVYWSCDSIDTPLTSMFPTTLRPRTATLRYRIRTSSALEEVSCCALSFTSCLRVTTRPRDFSEGVGLTRGSRIRWRAKTFSSAGIRVEPTLSSER